MRLAVRDDGLAVRDAVRRVYTTPSSSDADDSSAARSSSTSDVLNNVLCLRDDDISVPY